MRNPRVIKRRNPWIRDRDPNQISFTSDESSYSRNYGLKRPKFSANDANKYLDIETKLAAFKASQSLVSLVSYSGEEQRFQSSGTIIESNDHNGFILTSANLVRRPPADPSLSESAENAIADNIKVYVYLSDGKLYDGQIFALDFHYNIAVIKIQSDSPMPTAILRCLDDSATINPSQVFIPEEKPFQLRPHSSAFNLIPGDRVIALGRYFIKPYDLMAAPGEFSLDLCEHDCKELLSTTCKFTRSGDGGPLINLFGEVIGIIFYDMFANPFLPINVVHKWWEHYKKYGEFRRPCLGMEIINLYAADLQIVEKIIQKFPSISKGVIIEVVISGSSADSAGICTNDVIVQCSGKTVQSSLELFDIIWDKVGDSVELVVIRESYDTPLHLSMVVAEASPDHFYGWPHLENGF